MAGTQRAAADAERARGAFYHPKMDSAGTGILHQIGLKNDPWTSIY